MRNRIIQDNIEKAVGSDDIQDAIVSVLQNGGIAEVKVENHANECHVTVVRQERKLVEDVKL